MQQATLDLLYSQSYLPELSKLGNRTYDKHVAALCALLSMAAYDDSADGTIVSEMVAARLAIPRDKVKVKRFDATAGALLLDTNGFVVSIPSPAHQGKDIVVVAFRGTEFLGKNFLIDVFADARAVPVDFPDASSFVHGGFLNSADLAWGELLRMLDPSTTAQLYVTGHSLGGAVAALAAARMFHSPVALKPRMDALRAVFDGVYTYGQPMLGGEGFASWADSSGFRSLLFRHVYRADWVPHLPPLSTGLLPQHRYRHVGLERRAGDLTPFASAPDSGPVWFASITGLMAALPFLVRPIRPLSRLPLLYSIEDHQPDYYWRACERSLTDSQPGSVTSQRLRAHGDVPRSPGGHVYQASDSDGAMAKQPDHGANGGVARAEL